MTGFTSSWFKKFLPPPFRTKSPNCSAKNDTNIWDGQRNELQEFEKEVRRRNRSERLRSNLSIEKVKLSGRSAKKTNGKGEDNLNLKRKFARQIKQRQDNKNVKKQSSTLSAKKIPKSEDSLDSDLSQRMVPKPLLKVAEIEDDEQLKRIDFREEMGQEVSDEVERQGEEVEEEKDTDADDDEDGSISSEGGGGDDSGSICKEQEEGKAPIQVKYHMFENVWDGKRNELLAFEREVRERQRQMMLKAGDIDYQLKLEKDIKQDALPELSRRYIMAASKVKPKNERKNYKDHDNEDDYDEVYDEDGNDYDDEEYDVDEEEYHEDDLEQKKFTAKKEDKKGIKLKETKKKVKYEKEQPAPIIVNQDRTKEFGKARKEAWSKSQEKGVRSLMDLIDTEQMEKTLETSDDSNTKNEASNPPVLSSKDRSNEGEVEKPVSNISSQSGNKDGAHKSVVPAVKPSGEKMGRRSGTEPETTSTAKKKDVSVSPTPSSAEDGWYWEDGDWEDDEGESDTSDGRNDGVHKSPPPEEKTTSKDNQKTARRVLSQGAVKPPDEKSPAKISPKTGERVPSPGTVIPPESKVAVKISSQGTVKPLEEIGVAKSSPEAKVPGRISSKTGTRAPSQGTVKPLEEIGVVKSSPEAKVAVEISSNTVGRVPSQGTVEVLSSKNLKEKGKSEKKPEAKSTDSKRCVTTSPSPSSVEDDWETDEDGWEDVSNASSSEVGNDGGFKSSTLVKSHEEKVPVKGTPKNDKKVPPQKSVKPPEEKKTVKSQKTGRRITSPAADDILSSRDSKPEKKPGKMAPNSTKCVATSPSPSSTDDDSESEEEVEEQFSNISSSDQHKSTTPGTSASRQVAVPPVNPSHQKGSVKSTPQTGRKLTSQGTVTVPERSRARTTQQSPKAAQEPPKIAQQPSKADQKSPKTTQQPPRTAYKVPKASQVWSPVDEEEIPKYQLPGRGWGIGTQTAQTPEISKWGEGTIGTQTTAEKGARNESRVSSRRFSGLRYIRSGSSDIIMELSGMGPNASARSKQPLTKNEAKGVQTNPSGTRIGSSPWTSEVGVRFDESEESATDHGFREKVPPCASNDRVVQTPRSQSIGTQFEFKYTPENYLTVSCSDVRVIWSKRSRRDCARERVAMRRRDCAPEPVAMRRRDCAPEPVATRRRDCAPEPIAVRKCRPKRECYPKRNQSIQTSSSCCFGRKPKRCISTQYEPKCAARSHKIRYRSDMSLRSKCGGISEASSEYIPQSCPEPWDSRADYQSASSDTPATNCTSFFPSPRCAERLADRLSSVTSCKYSFEQKPLLWLCLSTLCCCRLFSNRNRCSDQ